MLWRWLYESDSGAEGTVGEEEDGLKWAAREERRLRADDMLGGRSACSWPWELQCCLEEKKVQLIKTQNPATELLYRKDLLLVLGMYSKNKQKDQRQLLRKVKCQTPFLDDDLLSIGESVGKQQPRLSGLHPQKLIIVMRSNGEMVLFRCLTIPSPPYMKGFVV